MKEIEVKEILTKMQGGDNSVTVDKKIEIFNWWLRNKAPAISIVYPNEAERWLKTFQIETANRKSSQLLIDYSMMKISERLNIIPASTKTVVYLLSGIWAVTNQ